MDNKYIQNFPLEQNFLFLSFSVLGHSLSFHIHIKYLLKSVKESLGTNAHQAQYIFTSPMFPGCTRSQQELWTLSPGLNAR
jgi:hypothetical protein